MAAARAGRGGREVGKVLDKASELAHRPSTEARRRSMGEGGVGEEEEEEVNTTECK